MNSTRQMDVTKHLKSVCGHRFLHEDPKFLHLYGFHLYKPVHVRVRTVQLDPGSILDIDVAVLKSTQVRVPSPLT